MTAPSVGASLGASSGLPPRAQYRVSGCCSDIFFADGEEFSPDEPAHCRLHGTFRASNRFGECLIADLDGRVGAPLLVCQPKIDEETDGSAVMADKVAHEHLENVIVHGGHRYTNDLYSNAWMIATVAAASYALPRLGGPT